MKKNDKVKIFLVDDDAVTLKLMQIEFLQQTDFEVETYPTGEACVENLSHNPDLIVLDYHLDGIQKHAMNGMQTLDKIKAFHKDIPVVMLSSQDKIEVAVDCMHHKATDYVVKGETAFMRIKQIVHNVLTFQSMQKELSWYMDRM